MTEIDFKDITETIPDPDSGEPVTTRTIAGTKLMPDGTIEVRTTAVRTAATEEEVALARKLIEAWFEWKLIGAWFA